MPKRARQCPRCGRWHKARERQCVSCGTFLVRRPFRMTPARVRLVHAIAARKGLIVGEDDELYRLRLGALGVTTCKRLRRRQFETFLAELRDLPDRGGRG